MIWLFAGSLLLLTALLLYWLLVITEGVFLGRRMVIWLYDITAHRYEAIKQFNYEDDLFAIGQPLVEALSDTTQSRILDVASGTGRVPALMVTMPGYHGRVFALEPASRMLAQAAGKRNILAPDQRERWALVQGTGAPLPFADNQFHAVTCLEALEFMPSDVEALREMVRVLKPGGTLMTSRRRGRDARLFLGRYRPAGAFENLLAQLGLDKVQTLLWQVDYDMVMGRKP